MKSEIQSELYIKTIQIKFNIKTKNNFLLFVVLFLSQQCYSQNNIQEFIQNKDAELINYSFIKNNNINSIICYEKIDSTLFKGYSVSNYKYIVHTATYNKNGYTEMYQWNFYNNNQSRSEYYITNDYNYNYDSLFNLSEIKVSDASQIINVSYNYYNDSLIQIIKYIDKLSNVITTQKKMLNNLILKLLNSGVNQIYYPDIQIINVGTIKTEHLLINNIPFYSFFGNKFENNRLLIQICNYKYIFVEIN